ncbi:MAG: alpha/beta hydrolase [Lachnospiraceae bacterium]|nr:alpha/beta hydrolase [Lachnospiraceae bacterium]
MATLNSHMTFKELAAASPYQNKISKYIFVNGDTMADYDTMTPAGIAFEEGSIIMKALQSLEDAHDAGCDRDYKVYSESEIAETPSKEDVRLFFFPGKKDAPYVLLVPGGAYVQVWSWTEGFESAMEFNKNDINAFVLSYRANVPGLLPDPIEDIAAAIRFITANDFPVNKKSYAVCGFSAGAHATSIFGTDNHGFSNFDIPAPDALFLIYPVISTDILYDEYKASGADYEQNLSYVMLQRIGGNDFTRESLEEYNAIKHCNNYPPAFLIHGEADDLVDPRGTEDLHKALEAAGIRHHYETVPGTGHGFSAGKGSAADGWIERAIDFWKSITAHS